MKPVPVEFNPTNVSEVRINTPCLIQGVNVLDALYSLGTPAPVGTKVNHQPNPVTELSRSVNETITALSGSVSASISAINLYSNYTNFKEVGPLTPNPGISYEATQSDNCIITYSNGADLFTATIVSIPPKDSLRLGTTFIIKNSYASPYNSYVSIDQTTGAQTIEGNTARITLSVGSSIKILLVRSGLWMIIP